jgi:hypothetical protein
MIGCWFPHGTDRRPCRMVAQAISRWHASFRPVAISDLAGIAGPSGRRSLDAHKERCAFAWRTQRHHDSFDCRNGQVPALKKFSTERMPDGYRRSMLAARAGNRIKQTPRAARQAMSRNHAEHNRMPQYSGAVSARYDSSINKVAPTPIVAPVWGFGVPRGRHPPIIALGS